jgi:hypothetical protein
MGVPLRFCFAPGVSSDLRGRPGPRLTGEDASESFSGIVLVVVRVICWIMGDVPFSSEPLPGSASSVTLMRHGLAPPARPVFITIDLDGDFDGDLSSHFGSDTLARRFCLLGELDVRGVLLARAVLPWAVSFALLTDALSGSGEESGKLLSKSPLTMLARPRGAIASLCRAVVVWQRGVAYNIRRVAGMHSRLVLVWPVAHGNNLIRALWRSLPPRAATSLGQRLHHEYA